MAFAGFHVAFTVAIFYKAFAGFSEAFAGFYVASSGFYVAFANPGPASGRHWELGTPGSISPANLSRHLIFATC